MLLLFHECSGHLRRLLLACLCCGALLSAASAQSAPPSQPAAPLPDAPAVPASSSQADGKPSAPPNAGTPKPGQTKNKRDESERELKKQESQRMLGIIPAFNEVMGGSAPPLNAREKFDLFFHGAFDPYQFVIVGLDAGIEQWEDQFPEYHYGLQGYGRRYLAAFGDNFDGNFWGNAVLPSLLRQDPRYFRLGHGSVAHRISYAAISAVRCKGDNGHWQPNVSNVVGNLIGGGISNLYYPASDRGVGLTFERGMTVTATGALGSIAEEFYPDVAAYFSRRHARKLAAQRAALQAKQTAQPQSAPSHE